MPVGQELLNIVQGCIKAKRESQKELYKTFYGFSMAIAMRYCSTQDDAMEVVNDSFLKVFKQLENFEARHSNFETSLKGWIKSILVHTAIDHFRKNNKYAYLSETTDEQLNAHDPSETSIDKMTYKEILEIVQRLSPVYRTVFNLYVIDGYKHEEIAEQLKISVGTSKSNLSKAKFNIQKMLKAVDSPYYERKAI